MTTDLQMFRPEPPALVDLRADAGAAGAFAEVLGVTLPSGTPGSAMAGELAVLRLAPDRWLVRAPMSEEATLAARLDGAAEGRHAMVTVLSDAFALFRLRGAGVPDLLSQGVAIDLDARVFAPGSATRCALAKTCVVLHRHDGPADQTWDIYVESPLQRYLEQWLRTAHDPRHLAAAGLASEGSIAGLGDLPQSIRGAHVL